MICQTPDATDVRIKSLPPRGNASSGVSLRLVVYTISKAMGVFLVILIRGVIPSLEARHPETGALSYKMNYYRVS
jgi:hypothetical protein